VRLPSTRALRRLCAVLFVAVVLMWLAAAGIWLARGPYPLPGIGDSLSELPAIMERALQLATIALWLRPSTTASRRRQIELP
jgi:hypothetical protein